MSPLRLVAFSVPLLLALSAPLGAAVRAVEGIASVAWGDPLAGPTGGPLRLTVRDEAGVDHVFNLPYGSPAAGFDPGRAQGRRVRVVADESAAPGAAPLAVVFYDLSDPAAPAVSGSQPWVSLLCKFSNVATEPKPASFFSEMYANSPGRLDHYWREVSYDRIDIVGSTATSWLVLPNNQTYYVPTPGSGCLDADPNNNAKLNLLFDDCTAAANPFVDFSAGGTGGFVGINLMFNSDLDGCAWGGGRYATLDGVSKTWRTTWEPPWGYANVAVMAHEMGHGFGLPHSNNWDNDGWPYDNSWDVMSDAWGYAGSDGTYGTLPKHTIAYGKDRLGWFSAGEVFTPPGDGVWHVELADVARPAPVDGYRMIRLPIPSAANKYWTVETRDLTGLYDAELPGHAVIVHQVDPGRAEPAWCYDPQSPPDGEADRASVMFVPGEIFASPSEATFVSVDGETPDGFAVTVFVDAGLIFVENFEVGNFSRWSSIVQP